MTITPHDVRDAYFVGAAIGVVGAVILSCTIDYFHRRRLNRKLAHMTPKQLDELRELGLL